MNIAENVALAPLTTLGLGGGAKYLLRAHNEADVREGLGWATSRGLDVLFLGGGSNVVIGDAGFAGVVVVMEAKGIEALASPAGQADRICLRVAAGETWDDFVGHAVSNGWTGIECLSGIPGTVGATPIQNVGAYGQEVSDTIGSVRVFSRLDGITRDMPADACRFSYRDSIFKQNPEHFVVLSVTFSLRKGPPAALRYGELTRALSGIPDPTVALVRETVLALRAKKSMVIRPDDPNRRSAGSFFTNPVVSNQRAERLIEDAVASGLVDAPEDVPRFPAGEAQSKFAAGWLIERAGCQRGERAGHVGISDKHALALVHHGGGTTQELLRLAASIQQRVWNRFAIALRPEPVFVNAKLPEISV